MVALNRMPVKSKLAPVTFEGGPSYSVPAFYQLRRTVMSCMLWEDTFYEDGQTVADRIKSLVPKCKPEDVSRLAIEVRTAMKLRHAPLLLAREMARHDTHKHLVCETLCQIIQRPDEMAEFLAIYWADNKEQPLSAQVKKGLAFAFSRFDSFQLAKYNRDGAVKLRDVMFLVHPKPRNPVQAQTFKQLANNTIPPPDTWEVALSGGADKKATFTRLIQEGALGGLAFLRNLRNMEQSGVTQAVIRKGFAELKTERILPYRYIAAARHAPSWEPELEKAMMQSIAHMQKLPGRTVLLVDVSGSMGDLVSAKSQISRLDAACGLAVLLREVCEVGKIYAFNHLVKQIPARHGFALRDAIKAEEGGSTMLAHAIRQVNTETPYDRIIVFTDEQSADGIANPNGLGYVINVASAKNGVGYGKWVHIDGFSEQIVNYIGEYERWDKAA